MPFEQWQSVCEIGEMKRKSMVNDFSILSLELSYFFLVFENKSINGAARKIGQDPANISRILSRLEKSLSSKLFVRHQAGLRPTPKAEELYDALVRARQAFTARIADGQDKGRRIRIGFSPTVGFTYFTKYFTRPLERAGLTPEFTLANSLALVEAIKRRELDFALVANSPKFPGVVARAVATENLVLASLSGRHEKTLVVSSEMIGLERIAKSVNYQARWVMNDYFVLCGLLLEGREVMGIIPESLLVAFPKLKTVEIFQREGKITVLTWPGSLGLELLAQSKA